MVEIALGQQPNMFDSHSYPSAFTEEAIVGLQRHGYPWGPIVKLAFDPGLAPDPEDAYFQGIVTDSSESLNGRFAQLVQEARNTIQTLSAARDATLEEPVERSPAVEIEGYAADQP